MQEMLQTWVPSLGRDDPGAGHDSHFQVLPGGPRDRETWLATVHGFAKSNTTEMTEQACRHIVDKAFWDVTSIYFIRQHNASC